MPWLRAVAWAAALAAVALAASPWPQTAYQDAQALLAQMTLSEKLSMVYGQPSGYVGGIPGVPRLGVPPLHLEDGPQGVADGVTQVTAWPSALTVCMSWDADAMFQFGAAMGAEQVIKGTNVMLGPGVNLARVPWCGRTFEYLGEDPVLASRMVAAEVAGIQSNNVSGCVKHFVDNSQETDRGTVSENVPARAQWELYYQPFVAAVDAGVGSAMCSYNRVNNTYACENAETLAALKDAFGFDGWVMSDWGATHSTVPAALAGLDQQMPDGSYFGAPLAQAVADGQVPESRVDDMVMRMLVPMFALGLMANPPTGNLGANALSAAHNTLARTLAERSTVLLQNADNLLPIDAGSVTSVAVFGDQDTVAGCGSGGVIPPYVVTPFQGIYTYLNGAPPSRPPACTFVQDVDFFQPGNPCVAAASAQDCCAICSNRSDCNAFTFVAGAACASSSSSSSSSSGQCWLKPNDAGQRPHKGLVSGRCGPFLAGKVNVTYDDGTDPVRAERLAASVQYAVAVVATTSCEGSDRPNLSLPHWQDAMVAAVAAANPRTVVVVRSPGAVLMPWLDVVSSVLFELMPGQEAGNAIANVIFGEVNPSGKLPLSFPRAMNDTWLQTPEQYPGTVRNNSWTEVDYSEGLLMGYRWYDAQGTDPLFPFGHGLSYSSFEYSQLQVSPTVGPGGVLTVSCVVRNVGPFAGAEVAQLYVGYDPAADEPPKLLKDFAKFSLQAGASTTVSFELPAQALQVWLGQWTLVPGQYVALVGSSSRDIRLQAPFTVTASS